MLARGVDERAHSASLAGRAARALDVPDPHRQVP
jgi:hypothetical protein